MGDNSMQPHPTQAEHENQTSEIISIPNYLTPQLSNHSFSSSLVIGQDDIPPITGAAGLFSAFKKESKKLWRLAGPAILTTIFQYSLGAITLTFAGQVGTLDLAAFSVENSVISGLTYGVMSEDISRAAGRFSRWMIPQLFAYAMNFPMAKFLQAQSKIMVIAWISAAALAFHVLFSWLLMLKLGWGMAGGALVLNVSWWFVVVGQMIYIFSGACGNAWTGFSWKAFQNLWGFVKLSVASAVMLCLEVWYYTALILFAGYMKNAKVAVDALSICVNILGWMGMVSVGFNAAISVRVSNELGAANPRTAKFSVLVVVISSFSVALLISITFLVFRKQYPSLFSESSEVQDLLYKLTPMLAFCIVLNNVQPTLSGVAIGAGWQAWVAYVNIASYYLCGIPLGLVLGHPLKMGVRGIWYGMVGGTVIQTLIISWFVYKTNWDKEASAAAQRIKKWGGEPDVKENNLEK